MSKKECETDEEGKKSENVQKDIDDEQSTDEEELEELTKEQLEEEVDELEKSLKKVMADFDNYRKRTLREKNRIIEQATETLMVDLLGILDDFERALNSDDELDLDGVDMIYKKFYTTLKEHGLE